MTNDEQSIRLVGFHVSMLYIHHRMMITYLERKEPHLIDGYAQSDFLGAQHHARSLLDALNAMIAEGADLKEYLGNTYRNHSLCSLCRSIGIDFLGPCQYRLRGEAVAKVSHFRPRQIGSTHRPTRVYNVW